MSEEIKDIHEQKVNAAESSSYRSIFKATSLFGGVQVYTILVQVVKGKIIAVLLGPLGVGIQGLFQSALDLVKQATSLGISQSAVRDVAEADGTGDVDKINRIVTVLRKIVWFTGLLGMVGIIALSPVFSHTSFGNNDYIWSFVILSIILLLDQITAGQRVEMQGTRRLRDLAKSTALGVTASLFVSLPFYYFWGIKGIVPAMILTAVVSLIASWYYARKIPIKKVHLTPNEVAKDGKGMMVMGISMSISGVLSMGVAYLIRSLIRKWGGIDEVGLFQAGFVIINSYVGLVFNAISTDYYPRLASVNKDNKRCSEVVSQQGEISVFLLAPLLSICIIAMPLVIRLLYSNEFLPADIYIKYSCLGMMFRLASWLISYMFIAKAESKLLIINEFIGNANYLWLSLVGYKLGGLAGIGVAFAVNYLLYFIQVFMIARFRYEFSFSSRFMGSFILQLILVCICLVSVLIIPGFVKYIVGALIMLMSFFFGFKGLDDRIELRKAIKTLMRK